MKLNVDSLPSKGYASLVKSIEINPLTYKEILDYESKINQTEAERLLWDIKKLINTIPNANGLCLYDLRSLIFTRKYISCTFNDNIILDLYCPLCMKEFKHKLNIEDLKFNDLSDEFQKIRKVIINGKIILVTIPSISEFEYCLETIIDKYGYDIDIKIPYLATCLGFRDNPNLIDTMIMSATHDEVLILDMIYNFINGSVDDVNIKCPNHGGELVIKLQDLITSVFQSISSNQELDPKKIITG